MNFGSVKATQVFEQYERRRTAEAERMARLPMSEGLAQRDDYLLAVGPESGNFLHSLILATKPSLVLELGTSYGYSTLFLADAAARVGGRVISIDCAHDKLDYAKARLREAGLDTAVELVAGDAVTTIETIETPIDFVLLDIWKELYVPCFRAFYPKLSTRGLIAADNMIFPEQARSDVREYRQLVNQAPDLSSTLLPIGSGIELATRWPANHPDL